MSDQNFIVIRPLGSVGDTPDDLLLNEFRVPYLVTGDIFRAHVEAQTDLGKQLKAIMFEGGLVPDKLVVDIVAGRLSEDDVQAG